jgi:hypothetical protein
MGVDIVLLPFHSAGVTGTYHLPQPYFASFLIFLPHPSFVGYLFFGGTGV